MGDGGTARVVVSGIRGRMGRTAAGAILAAPGFALVGAVSGTAPAGTLVGDLLGNDCSVPVQQNLGSALRTTNADAVVVFSLLPSAMEDIRTAIAAGVVPVVGTTGMTPDDLEEIRGLACEHGTGAIIAPNFAIGAVLMMKFAAEAAKHLPSLEITELHRHTKLDAPSGTAIKTARMSASVENTPPPADLPSAARGGEFDGLRVHSIRLPGLVAHQEVSFGGLGQTLTIRHDSYTSESFVPGLLLALHRTLGLGEVIYGLDQLL